MPASPSAAPPHLRPPDHADWREDLTERLVLFLVRPRASARQQRQRESLRTSRAKRILSQLRRYLGLAALLSGLDMASVFSLAVRGSAALVASDVPECSGPLRAWLACIGPATWLQGFAPVCVVLPALARWESHGGGWALLQHCWPLLSVALFCWCAGVATSVRPPPSCRALDGRAFEIVALQCLTACVVVTTDVCLLEVQPLLKKLGSIVSGRSASDAAALVRKMPGCEPFPGEECAICIGCMEDEDDVLRSQLADEGTDLEGAPGSADGHAPLAPMTRWLRLPCGHSFHRTCLFQWVTKARPSASKHCPLCRSRFREALRSSRAAQVSVAHTASAAAAAAATSTSAPLLGGAGPGAAAAGACDLDAWEGAGALSSGSAAA